MRFIGPDNFSPAPLRKRSGRSAIAPTACGIEIDVQREPVGVVAIISPWNFPTATASWKIAPALAFGNTMIWKPANLTPASGRPE